MTFTPYLRLETSKVMLSEATVTFSQEIVSLSGFAVNIPSFLFKVNLTGVGSAKRDP